MKRLFILPILLCFVLSGCLGLETTDSQEYAVKKLARITGITIGLEHPEDVDKAYSYLTYLDNLEDGTLKDAAIDVAVKYAYEKYGKTSKTVILVAEVVDLLKIAIPDEAGGNLDSKLLNLAVDGMKEGLELTK